MIPVVPTDFTSMYPSVQTLMGLESFLTCERIDAVEADPMTFGRWVGKLTASSLFRPRTWKRLRVICEVAPEPGDVFPIRARYGGSASPFGIGVNPWAEAPPEPVWYTGPTSWRRSSSPAGSRRSSA
jgi:hypothetical protein